MKCLVSVLYFSCLILSVNCMSLCVCAAEELNTLKGIEGDSPEDKPPQQVK